MACEHKNVYQSMDFGGAWRCASCYIVLIRPYKKETPTDQEYESDRDGPTNNRYE